MITERIDPTPERIRQAGGAYDRGNRSKRAARQKSQQVARVSDGSVFDRLAFRNELTPRQKKAGEKLRSDIEGASLAPRTTCRWEPPVDGEAGTREMTDHMVACRQRVSKAHRALGGSVWRVLEHGFRIDISPDRVHKVMTGRSHPQQARAGAIEAVKLALDALADHYQY